MKIYHRLRPRLIALFFITTLIPTLLTGIYAIHISGNTLRDLALTKQVEQAKNLANRIESFLKEAKNDLLFLSQCTPLRDYVNLRMAIALDLESEQHLPMLPGGSLETAKQAVERILEQKQQILEQEFLAFSRNRGIYYQVRYLDETGKEVVRINSSSFRSWAVPRQELQNKADRYYFKETMRLSGKRVFVSPLDLNRERGQIEYPHKPVIRYAVSVYDDKNQKAGIVITNVDANQFLKEITDVRLVNEEGYFLSHPNPDPDQEKRWGGPNDLNTGYNLEQEYPKLATKIINRDGILSNPTITLSHRRVVIPGTSERWTLIVQQDTKEVFRSLTQFSLGFAIILLVSTSIILFMAWLVSGKITYPIEQLTHLADLISKGELVDNPVRVNDKGEIGQLAQAFERMRVSMIKSFERLRKQTRML